MNHSSLVEVIIPVKDRLEVLECVRSLNTVEAKIARIVVCDGGSTDAQCIQYLHELECQNNVCVMHFPAPGFNKSLLLNRGLLQATSEFLLISDADIIWNAAALDALLSSVSSSTNTICYVQDVEESQPDSVALKRDRYTYEVTVNNHVASVNVLPADSYTKHRHGCGLICARRTTLIALGGYKEFFQGWGWEDQDLLIRAQLCGINLCAAGKVMHISHDDTARNKYHNNLEPGLTRNKNIIASLKSLAQGVLLGDLPRKNMIEAKLKQIQVFLPESLMEHGVL